MSGMMDRLSLLRGSKVKPATEPENVAKTDESAAATQSPLAVPDEAHKKNLDTLLLERKWKKSTYDQLFETIDTAVLSTLPEAQARKQINAICSKILEEAVAPLSQASRERVVKQLENEVLGLGPLEELLQDKTISDIMVNGSQKIYIERFGKLELSDVVFNDDAHLMKIIDRIVTQVGRRIDESSPMVDARLKDGSRVNAIIPPLALDGPSMSIRRFTVEKLKVENLIAFGSLNEQIAQVLDAIVKLRLNVLISGGTGSGKTTLLNILSGFIPVTERIVTIEDSAELQLQQPHVVRLETRPPNLEGKGEVTQRDLVRNSLRMRPDRIVIGEVRGAEAMDMLQAMNTGHDGSLATVHANTPRDALARIENMVAMGGFNIPMHAMRSQIASAIDVVVQIQRMEDGGRRLISLQQVDGMEGDIITMSEIFRFERRGTNEAGKVEGDYRSTGVVPSFYSQLKLRGIDLNIDVFKR